MPAGIWTRCAGGSELRPLRLVPWRAVEAQHQISTRKLVDALEEHELLEDLLERAKPPLRTPPRLHYLLATPFRYPPLRHGSRFGARHEPGIWYGAEARRTVFAEVAYYRLVFLEATHAELGTVATQLTAFTVRVRTARGIDLTRAPFSAHRGAISSPDSYATAQQLGRDMRAAGVEALRYHSARDRAGGVNVAVLSAAVFGAAKPRAFETWHCTATRRRVEFVRHWAEKSSFAFAREDFLVAGRLPAPAP